MRNLIRGIVGVMLLALASACLAEQIKIGLTGHVDYIDDPYNLLDNGVHQGDWITGFYTYDSSTQDSNPSVSMSLYQYAIAPYGMLVTAGSITFQTDPTNVNFEIGLVDNYAGGTLDSYEVTSHNNLQLNSAITVGDLHWQLNDYSGKAISSDALPSTAPDLSKWQSNSLSVVGGSDEKTQFLISGHITSSYLIPEPATLFLLAIGGLIIRKRN
jgi:hypothetical protein